MVVQDPPVVLGEEASAGDTFNPDYFREYTSTGVTVEYTVWLPLLLCENGALLCKGVAQPLKKSRSKSAPLVRQAKTNASRRERSATPSEVKVNEPDKNKESEWTSRYGHADPVNTEDCSRNYQRTVVKTNYTSPSHYATVGSSKPSTQAFRQEKASYDYDTTIKGESSLDYFQHKNPTVEYDSNGSSVSYYLVKMKGALYANFNGNLYALDYFRQKLRLMSWHR